MSEIKFRPVKGTEADLLKIKYTDGAVYFATDTGKIYMDANGSNKMSIGGGGSNSGIYYGTRETKESDSEEDAVITFTIKTEIEGTKLPGLDDLILNAPDGCFYRVIDIISGTEVQVKKLTVAGNGSGSSTTGLTKKTSVDIVNLEGTTSFINGKDAYVSITVHSAEDENGEKTDEEGKINLSVVWQARNDDATYTTYYQDTTSYTGLNDGATIKLNFGAHAKDSTQSRLVVTAEGADGGKSTSKNFLFATSVLSLSLAETFDKTNYFNSTSINITCNALGSMDRIVDFYWDGELIDSQTLAAADTGRNLVCEVQKKTTSVGHGYHTVEIQLHQLVNEERKLGTDPITFEVGVNADGSDPIIWLDTFDSEYYNYDDIELAYYIYQPGSTEYTVTLYKDNIKNSEHPFTNVSGTTSDSFEIVDADEGGVQNFYTIACNGISRDVFFKIVDDPDRDMHLQQNLYLDLSFDAKGRSNNESETNRKIWTYQNTNNSEGKLYKGTFNNFNWYNNGWIKTDDGTALRISNGASFSIPLGTMTFAGSDKSSQSHTFEFQFKIRNVQSYENLISNITRYKNDEQYYTAFYDTDTNTYKTEYTNYDAFLQWYATNHDLEYDDITKDYDYTEKRINLSALACGFYSGNAKSVVGFGLGPQDAFFSNGTNTVSASYVEDKMVNLAIVYDNSDGLISIYVNGILTGVIYSTVNGAFTINSDTLTFNSTYCDIDLYKFRVYRTPLTINEVVTNYAVDLKDVIMYDQNTLVDASNKTLFSFNEMLSYNENHASDPIMPYIIFDTSDTDNGDRLSWSKSTKVNIGVEFVNTVLDRAYQSGELETLAAADGVKVEEYYAHHCPSFKGSNISMAVQGTSSEFYPRRNYKLKLKDDDGNIHMTMHKGPYSTNNTDSKWFYMNNYSVGTTKFTMKIDFMESSGSYNRGLANLINNAHSQHPLQYYLEAGAISKAVDEYSVDTSGTYNEKTTYYYWNHKGNLKPADGSESDGLKISSEADYLLGPIALASQQGVTKVYTTDVTNAAYNKWFTGSTKYVADTSFLDTSELRTNVQGFPVLAFHKKSDGTYTYIGRYNMLTDKGADETFGFKNDNAFLHFLGDKNVKKKAECWEFENNSRTYCSFRDPLNRKHLSFNYDSYLDTETSTAPSVVEDFEYRFSTYADQIDELLGTRLDSLTTDQIADIKSELKVEVTGNEIGQNLIYDLYGNWEKAVAWVWSTCLDASFVKTEAEIAAMTDDEKKNYLIEKYVKVTDTDTYDSNKKYFKYLRHLYVDYTYVDADTWTADVSSGLYRLDNPQVTYGETTYTYDSYEYRYNKFRYELDKHFNIDYLATYFVTTECLELYDSRGKNCMMASWGPLESGGEYIWFPIFYDMDTQLGINNTGIPSFEFSIDATDEGSFSTNDSVLWNNFYLIFRNQILSKYRQLRGCTSDIAPFKALSYAPFSTEERIEAWYESDPDVCKDIVFRGQRPLSAINLDEYYKYIAITSKAGGGYLGQAGTVVYDNSSTSAGTGSPSGSYFYALQGDRSLSRIQFLKNRFNYLDSWLGQGIYSKSGGKENAFWGRLTANNTTGDDITSDKWVATDSDPYFTDTAGTIKAHEFDGEYWLTLTPSRKSYLKIIADDSEFTGKYIDSPVKVEVTKVKNAIQTSPNYKEQLIYIYGTEIMKSFGNLHNLYLTELHTVDSQNLTELILGWDGLDKDGGKWYNHQTNAYGLSSMPLLQEFNFCNIQYKNANEAVLDLTASEKLQNFRATGSNLQQIKFAEGVALNTLYLPSTITSLELTEARQLTKVLTSYTQPTLDSSTGKLVAEKGLFIENLTDRLDSDDAITNIGTLSILNANNLGYDAYKLLNKFYKIKKAEADAAGTGTVNAAKIAMTEVDWTPYDLVDEGTAYDSSKSYFLDMGHYQLEAYSYNPDADYKTDTAGNHIDIGEEWKDNISNGVLYVLDDSETNTSIIKDVEMLDIFINNNAFVGTAEGSSIPNITGTIYVDNDSTLTDISGTTIDEYYVRNTLQPKYPNLKFFFKTLENNYTAQFILLDSDDDGVFSGLYTTIGTQTIKEGWFTDPITAYGDLTELKPNYDFYGWALEDKGSDSDILIDIDRSHDTWSSQSINTSQKTYKFYAIFSVHRYTMTFIDGDGNTYLKKITYGDTISAPADTDFMPTKDDSKLDAVKTYNFDGWALSEDGPVIVLSNYKSTKNYTFYAKFSEVDVHSHVMDEKYFTIAAGEQKVGINAAYKLSGKITIPNKINGLDVLGFLGGSQTSSGFVGQTNITYIFLEDPATSKITDVGMDAFYGCTSLKYVELPTDGNVTIQKEAFRNCAMFADVDVSYIKTFFNSVTSIGQYAFRRPDDIEKVPLGFTKGELYFSAKTTNIGQQPFRDQKALTTIYFGSAEEKMAIPTFVSNAGIFTYDYNITDIYIYSDDSQQLWSDALSTYSGLDGGQYTIHYNS